MQITTGVAAVNGIRMHYLRAGDGPALVLLHGWPQTGHCWRKLLEPLAAGHTLLVPDLRGYGHTDKARTGYDKRTMASDVAELVRSCGFETATVLGHDRGARIGHRLGLDAPQLVERLVVMDVIPTREMWRRLDARIATTYWHWLFHLQPDLPELLVGDKVEAYLRTAFERWTYNRHGIEPAAVAEYVRAFSQPGALRCGFDDYRAAPVDSEHDDADAAAGRRLSMPVQALWGGEGLFGPMDVVGIWRDYATDVRGAAIPECGHFLPEEAPGRVLDELRGFLPGLGPQPEEPGR